MTKEILSARLRNACAEIRRTPMKISDLIPMLQESADALDSGAMPHPEHESLVKCAVAALKKGIAAQPQLVPLTFAEIDAIADDNNMGSIWYQDDPRQYWCSFARAIEAAHGIKETK